MESNIERTGTAGFTLIELLATAVLVGVVAAALYGGVRALLRLERRVSESIAVQKSLMIMENDLWLDLTNAVRIPMIAPATQSVKFALNTIETNRSGGIALGARQAKVTYLVLRSGGHGSCVVLRISSRDSTVDTTSYRFPGDYAVCFGPVTGRSESARYSIMPPLEVVDSDARWLAVQVSKADAIGYDGPAGERCVIYERIYRLGEK